MISREQAIKIAQQERAKAMIEPRDSDLSYKPPDWIIDAIIAASGQSIAKTMTHQQAFDLANKHKLSSVTVLNLLKEVGITVSGTPPVEVPIEKEVQLIRAGILSEDLPRLWGIVERLLAERKDKFNNVENSQTAPESEDQLTTLLYNYRKACSILNTVHEVADAERAIRNYIDTPKDYVPGDIDKAINDFKAKSLRTGAGYDPKISAQDFRARQHEMSNAENKLRTLLASILIDKAKQEGPKPHVDDAAVDVFAMAMKAKLAQKRAEGKDGWEDPALCTVEFLNHELLSHLAKGDPVDIGNYAMMLYNRGGQVSSQKPLSTFRIEDIYKMVAEKHGSAGQLWLVVNFVRAIEKEHGIGEE